jgi:hypothetical protein
MRRRHVSLSPVVDRAIESQVELGRYKDFSAAIQDAVWNYFIGPDSPFEEYGVTPEEVARGRKIMDDLREALPASWRAIRAAVVPKMEQAVVERELPGNVTLKSHRAVQGPAN